MALDEVPPRRPRARRVVAEAAAPLWFRDLDDPVHQVAAEDRLTLSRVKPDRHVAGRMTGPRLEGEVLVDRVVGVRQHGASGVDDRRDAVVDAGITPVHENCMNYGGMSWQHALELLDKAPGLKWVFDTANPVFNPDRSKPKPWPRQDPWEFWTHVRDHVVHIHVKDATWVPEKNDADYNWPSEGQGRVRDILKDAFARGYEDGISIEPHMVVVFHDANSKANDDAMRKNFVDYGRRLEKLIQELKGSASKTKLNALPSS